MRPASQRPRFHCPQCGAPVEVRSPAAAVVVCEYCRSALRWSRGAVAFAGEQAELIEGFTRLYRGATGSLGGQRFEVLGRVRYESCRAIWDEWFVQPDGLAAVWITEDDHALALQSELNVPVAHLSNLSAADRFTLQNRQFEVDETGEALCVGVEGQLPEGNLTGERYRFLDASSLDGQLTLGLELDAASPSAFLGRWLAHAEVQLDDEGDDW